MTFRSVKFHLTLQQILRKDNFVKIITKPSNKNSLGLIASGMFHRFILVVAIEKISLFVPTMIKRWGNHYRCKICNVGLRVYYFEVSRTKLHC